MYTKHKISLFLFLLLFAVVKNPAQGQVVSNLERFEADFDRGCAPFKVVITETDTFDAETVIQYDFNNDGIYQGFEEGEEISYVYDTAGTYTIIQLAGIDIPGVSKLDTLEITVFKATNPEFSVFTCAGNRATIKIEPDQYDQFNILYTPTDSIIVDQGDEIPSFNYPPGTHSISVRGLFLNGKDNCPFVAKNFTTIENLLPSDFNQVAVLNTDASSGALEIQYQLSPNVIYQLQKADNVPSGFQPVQYLDNATTSLILDSVNTETSLQIYRIGAYDGCQNTFLYSDTLSTILLDVTAESGQNRIEWNSYPLSFSQYELSKDGSFFRSFNNVNLKTFVDNEVNCFQDYCYRVSYRNTMGGVSYSDTVCVQSFIIYFPPPIKNTTVSVEGENIELKWTDPDNINVTSYYIQRQVDDDVFATIDSTTIREYTDMMLETDARGYCYRINYLDECRNRSNLGDLACSIFLTIEDNQLLEWNQNTGWNNGIQQYIVEVYSENGSLVNEINVGGNKWYEDTTFLTEQSLLFRIRSESNDDPSQIAYSNFVVKEVEAILWIPNSFTPNGDGLNDFFKPEGTLMKEFEMKIYTRYGDLIYSTEDQNKGWDGTYNGKEMPAVTYIYRVKATDNLDKDINRTGKLLLIRH